MKTKKKMKLKKGAYFLLLGIVVVIVGVILGINYYNDFKYSLASIKIKTRRLSDMEIIELIGRELNKQPNESIRKMIQKGGLDLYVQAEDRA